MMRALSVCLLAAVATAALAGQPADVAAITRAGDALEARLGEDPANLRVAAEYRQLVIANGRYHRSIKLFERLARDPRGGAHGYLNLALANVDRVPVAGIFCRALLGPAPLDALTRAIALAPTAPAYLIRGTVYLYYDQAMFHRANKAVADLETAQRLAAADVAYSPRILLALGDAYWRLNRHGEARHAWSEGARVVPDASSFSVRLKARDEQIPDILQRALDPDVRVDTTLRELFPDLTPAAWKALP